MMKVLLLLLAISAVKASDDPIDAFFRKLLEDIRPVMKTGIHELGVPPLDPLAIPNITANIKENAVDINLKVDGYRVSLLSSFKTNQVKASLEDHTLSMDISIPELDGDGYYDLMGEFRNIHVNQRGRVFVKKGFVTYKIITSLEKINDILQITEVNSFDESFTSIQVDMQSKPSYFGPKIDIEIGTHLINQIKSEVNNEIGKVFFNLFNKELAKTPISEIVKGDSPSFPYNVQYSPSANNYIDLLLGNLRGVIVQENLDPLPLPDFQVGFSQKILFVEVFGEAKLHNGLLKGLSTIHRAGDANIVATSQGIELSATLGLNQMVATYTGSAKFMDIGPSIKATVYVDNVRVYLKAAQNLAPGASPTLNDFRITSVGNLAVKIDGLGPLGWILGLLTTGVSNLIKDVIIKAIEGPIADLIRSELVKISIPV